ncbi:MAG: hypothetical protein FWF37_02100 [Chloroflexi bacterium]|nr:hypothetical protein [Chloroflexota bacterium]
MVAKDDTYKALARYLRINEATLYRKMSGRTDFLREEIRHIKERYELTSDEVETIFLSR